MKLLALFAFLAVACASRLPHDPKLDEHWTEFKRVYGKSYSRQEETFRRHFWEQHVNKIIQHNLKADLGLYSFRRGLNAYSDMSYEEFVNVLNGYKRPSGIKSNASAWIPPKDLHLPETVDWRNQGLVTPVKDQGPCGSCWSFSTTGSLEGQHKLKTKKLVSLSEQNLIDCSKPEGNNGCFGGWMDWAFTYIKQNGGIDTEESYPYKAEDVDTCQYKPSDAGATLTGYVDIPTGDEAALQKAVAAVGPISVAIDASHGSFHDYKSGIYDEPQCGPEVLDHAVLVVGYGTEDGQDYWLVKNSWGASWGIQGYIKMSRNKNNQCGIATKASYPLV